MKRFFSALLCAAALTGTLAVPAAGAASTDTTLRVGLTVGGASSFATPCWKMSPVRAPAIRSER